MEKTGTLARLALGIALAGIVLAGLTAPGAAAERHHAKHRAKRSVGSLLVSPGSLFVGGQQLTFSGDLGVSGVRRIHLQKNMGRIGDVWSDVEGFSTTTKPDGSFTFTYPAPSMFNIRMRVVGKGAVTGSWDFDAKSQDLTLSTAKLPGLDDGEVVMNLPFTIAVDTTPTLVGRPDLPPPVIPGRTLTLQQRVDGDTWKTLDTTRTSILGNGAFVQTVGAAGYVTYRVREEDWTKGGDKIGWYPSFPFTVRVVDPLHPNVGRDEAPTAPSRPYKETGSPSSRNGQTAAKAHLWGISLWDFAWTSGESLTSRPYRGTDRRGWWLDSSDGTGRAAQLNGQISLDSGRNFRGDGDVGTTRATMQDNPAAYGRWETAFRIKRFETGAQDYHAVLELVPERASDYRCGTRNITVADIDAGGHSIDIGARSASGTKWTATRKIDIGQRSAAIGIELGKSHITWFVDGRTVGVVNDPKAVSGVPMTLRFSLVGDGEKEMNHTMLFSDWQRSWTLDGGKQVTQGASLQRASYNASC
ncbi:hypothetical protein [Nocardioides mangrovi]|uniref:GH16 domain-containing protein n=1 Tax=Nocardioides mangrovi TaxID=2874580 RepID=A0ABS7UJP1_9ACTN|nr:hypothetical protein [Nocardioides mangrovi]MBZ5741005.1 hypothetical protein [Nocardioides mangrovi]